MHHLVALIEALDVECIFGILRELTKGNPRRTAPLHHAPWSRNSRRIATGVQQVILLDRFPFVEQSGGAMSVGSGVVRSERIDETPM